MLRILIGHPTANQFFRHACSAMHRAGGLAAACTALDGGAVLSSLGKLMPAGLRNELTRRSFPQQWADKLHTRPAREVVRLVCIRLGWRRWYKPERAPFSVDSVFHDFDRWMARQLSSPIQLCSFRGPEGIRASHPSTQLSAFKSQLSKVSAVYCYEDGALATFTRAKQLGMLCVYDLPIAYWETLRRLIAEERERLPAWAGTLGGGVSDSQAKLDRKARELELADMVIVPSQFVADSLPDWAKATKRVVISPFGSPGSEAAPVASEARTVAPVAHGCEQSSHGDERCSSGRTVSGEAATERAQPATVPPTAATGSQRDHCAAKQQPVGNADTVSQRDNRTAQRPLRVLFAGSMGQRKGLGDLMAAIRLLNRDDVELVCMGSLQVPMAFYQEQCPGFTYEAGRPHAEVLKLMRSCDVFCLPSIVEGRALVMQEAMSQGLPIIITPNTGGEDLVCGAGQIRRAETGKLKAEGSDPQHSDNPQLSAFKFQVSPSPQLSAFSSQLSRSRCERSATGFLVPIRSPEAIAEAIAWCADHRDDVAAMGRAAQAKAAEYTWEDYGNRIVDAIRDEIALRKPES